MIEKIQTVRNPLTIIAIFAAITEVSGTVVLPFVDHPNQLIFIYFLIFFPIILVFLFFLTLNFNYKVLYAPSDFRDDRSFIDLIKPASPFEINKKIDIETKELQAQQEITNIEDQLPIANTSEQVEINRRMVGNAQKPISYPDLKKRYFIGEQLVLDRIALEDNVIIKRNVKLLDKTGKSMVFDGFYEKGNNVILIEVKVLISTRNVIDIVTKTINKLDIIVDQLLNPKNISLLLALVFDDSVKYSKNIRNSLQNTTTRSKIPVMIRIYNLTELEAERDLDKPSTS